MGKGREREISKITMMKATTSRLDNIIISLGACSQHLPRERMNRMRGTITKPINIILRYTNPYIMVKDSELV